MILVFSRNSWFGTTTELVVDSSGFSLIHYIMKAMYEMSAKTTDDEYYSHSKFKHIEYHLLEWGAERILATLREVCTVLVLRTVGIFQIYS